MMQVQKRLAGSLTQRFLHREPGNDTKAVS
jgi:hypothetical protein